jgi:uncharacterized tellurite resistance protein B-like protein
MAADADMHTDENEIAANKFKINRILLSYFPGIEYNYDDCMKIIKSTKNIDNVTEVTKELLKKFNFSPDLRTDIISDLNDIVTTDEKVTAQEYEVVNKIRVLLKN